jgi:hypothetical protein
MRKFLNPFCGCDDDFFHGPCDDCLEAESSFQLMWGGVSNQHPVKVLHSICLNLNRMNCNKCEGTGVKNV